jgi:hypothetical protein
MWIDLCGKWLTDGETLEGLVDAAAGSSANDTGSLLDFNPYRDLKFLDGGYTPYSFEY